MSSIWEVFKPVIDSLRPAYDGIATIIGPAWDAVLPVLKWVWGWVKSFFIFMWENPLFQALLTLTICLLFLRVAVPFTIWFFKKVGKLTKSSKSDTAIDVALKSD
jgi:hypothetical protein